MQTSVENCDCLVATLCSGHDIQNPFHWSVNEHVSRYVLEDFSDLFKSTRRASLFQIAMGRSATFCCSSICLQNTDFSIRVRHEQRSMVRNIASATDCHLHGVARWTVKIKRYASVCKTTLFGCKAALGEVLQDSHFAGRIAKIEDPVW